MLTSKHSRVDERRAMTAAFQEGLDVRSEELMSRCQTRIWPVRSSLEAAKPPVPTTSPTFLLCLHQGACLCI